LAVHLGCHLHATEHKQTSLSINWFAVIYITAVGEGGARLTPFYRN